MSTEDHKMQPSAVIFDMDGVLTDTEPLHGECFRRAFKAMAVHITLEDYRRAVTLGGSTVKNYFDSLGGDVAVWEQIKALKDAELAEVIREHGKLMPGVIELLDLLDSLKIPKAIATSARLRSLEIILEPFNLIRRFDVIVTKEEVPAEKPHPGGFILAAERLGVDPAECVVIEDSPRGVLAAHRAGMKCIAVPTPSTHDGDFTPATLVIESLFQINIELLSSLFTSQQPPCSTQS